VFDLHLVISSGNLILSSSESYGKNILGLQGSVYYHCLNYIYATTARHLVVTWWGVIAYQYCGCV